MSPSPPPSPSPAQNPTAQQIVERARALAPRFAERAAAAEEARRIPESFRAGHARCRFRPHPAAAGDRRLRSRFRYLVRGDAGAQQDRCIARLVRRPDHSPRAPDRAISASGPEGGLGRKPRCADCGFVCAERESRGRKRRLPHRERRLALCQRRRSLLLGHARRHNARRSGAGMEILSGAARRIYRPRHLVHRRHARHRQQDHRRRQRVRAGKPRVAADRVARRQDPRQRHL